MYPPVTDFPTLRPYANIGRTSSVQYKIQENISLNSLSKNNVKNIDTENKDQKS